MNKTKTFAIILLPILTWLLVWVYQHWRRHKILEAQRQEFIAAKRQLEELARNLRGIRVNTPFPTQMPFRHVYLGPAPPIGHGKPVLIWVTYHNEFSFRKEVFERWQKLLNECPNLVLTVAIIGPSSHEVKAFGPPTISVRDIKVRMNHPRVTLLYSDDSLLFAVGPPGTIVLIDGKGITRYVGKLKAPIPYGDEEIKKLAEIVKTSGGEKR